MFAVNVIARYNLRAEALVISLGIIEATVENLYIYIGTITEYLDAIIKLINFIRNTSKE